MKRLAVSLAVCVVCTLALSNAASAGDGELIKNASGPMNSVNLNYQFRFPPTREHCENIMSADFNRIGVGYYSMPSAELQDVWVQTFGGRQGAD